MRQFASQDGLASCCMLDKACPVLDGTLGEVDEIKWRSFSGADDQGADGVCASGYLQRVQGAVLDDMWCSSHGSWRDFQKMLPSQHLVSFWLVLFITMNVVHGCLSEDAGHKAIDQGRDEMRAHFKLGACPLCLTSGRATASLGARGGAVHDRRLCPASLVPVVALVALGAQGL